MKSITCQDNQNFEMYQTNILLRKILVTGWPFKKHFK